MFRSSKKNKQKGMSYVELIVVLSIFSVLSAVSIFNYGDFQNRVDIKNLANDIALKIVEAQKASLSGLLPTLIPTVPDWKPAYGVYFGTSTPKQFSYFVDLNNNHYGSADEISETISITKNNSVSALTVFYQSGTSANLTNLAITFARPDSGAFFRSSSFFTGPISYVQITILSPKGATSLIKVYSSGRIQIN